MTIDVLEFSYTCETTAMDDCIKDNCKFITICNIREPYNGTLTMYYTEGEKLI